MKIPVPALLLALLCLGTPLHAVDNPDFSEGKKGWTGSGTAGFLDAAGEFSALEKPGSTPVLRVELSKTMAKTLSQRVSAKPDETTVNLRLRLLASNDFVRKDDARGFGDVDFKEGGQYVWSAPVHPRCDFLVRVSDSTYFYRPLSLRPIGQWKTFSVSIPDLKNRKREVELIFPPGDGAIYIQTGK